MVEISQSTPLRFPSRTSPTCYCLPGYIGGEMTDASLQLEVAKHNFLISRANPVLPCVLFADKKISSKKQRRQRQVIINWTLAGECRD